MTGGLSAAYIPAILVAIRVKEYAPLGFPFLHHRFPRESTRSLIALFLRLLFRGFESHIIYFLLIAQQTLRSSVFLRGSGLWLCKSGSFHGQRLSSTRTHSEFWIMRSHWPGCTNRLFTYIGMFFSLRSRISDTMIMATTTAMFTPGWEKPRLVHPKKDQYQMVDFIRISK